MCAQNEFYGPHAKMAFPFPLPEIGHDPAVRKALADIKVVVDSLSGINTHLTIVTKEVLTTKQYVMDNYPMWLKVSLIIIAVLLFLLALCVTFMCLKLCQIPGWCTCCPARCCPPSRQQQMSSDLRGQYQTLSTRELEEIGVVL